MPASPRFCIYGAGAIGGTIASRLVRCGASVSVVARAQTLAALKRDGIRHIVDGEVLQAPVRASADPAELGVQDYVIIATKEPALPDVARHIGPLLGPETAVVTAMNGIPWWFFLGSEGVLAGHQLEAIDPDGTIARAIPTSGIIGCVVYIAASVDEPGVIRHQSGSRLIIGEADNQPTPRLERLGDWLRKAGFDCRETPDIQREIWLKLWANLCMNPISLLTTATSDIIIDDPLLRRLCVSMMEEAGQIGSAIGVSGLPPVDRIIENIQSLGSFKMSMLQDVERGKPVEIDALLTAVREIGQLAGVPTPFIDGVLGLARLRAHNLGLFEGNFRADSLVTS